jgi:hypothetical protein
MRPRPRAPAAAIHVTRQQRTRGRRRRRRRRRAKRTGQRAGWMADSSGLPVGARAAAQRAPTVAPQPPPSAPTRPFHPHPLSRRHRRCRIPKPAWQPPWRRMHAQPATARLAATAAVRTPSRRQQSRREWSSLGGEGAPRVAAHLRGLGRCLRPRRRRLAWAPRRLCWWRPGQTAKPPQPPAPSRLLTRAVRLPTARNPPVAPGVAERAGRRAR